MSAINVRPSHPWFLLSSWLVWGCSGIDDTIEGRVVDAWGAPIAGVTVVVEGGTERPMTDEEGRYAVPRIDGKQVIKAGRNGYIQQHVEIDVVAGQRTEGPTFELLPQPEGQGLFIVLRDRYAPLAPEVVRVVGNDVRAYRGIRSVGSEVDVNRPRVVWHTSLRPSEISRLGLELRRLSFVERAEIPNTEGNKPVPVNLFVDDGPVPTEFTALRSRSDYMIVPTEPLQPGQYAFQTQKLLSDDEGRLWERLPPELRVVHPFEVR